jgi:hypothetical protein
MVRNGETFVWRNLKPIKLEISTGWRMESSMLKCLFQKRIFEEKIHLCQNNLLFFTSISCLLPTYMCIAKISLFPNQLSNSFQRVSELDIYNFFLYSYHPCTFFRFKMNVFPLNISQGLIKFFLKNWSNLGNFCLNEFETNISRSFHQLEDSKLKYMFKNSIF